MNRSWYFRGEKALGVFKYAVAIFMMVAGVLTPLQDTEPVGGALGFLYASKISLGLFGLVFFTSGAVLFYGKMMKNKRFVGLGLMLVFICFLFSGLIETIARHVPSIGNFTSAGIMGLLYLRWRLKTAYIDPNHFKAEIDEIKDN